MSAIAGIEAGDHIVSKTHMARVEAENTRLRHYSSKVASPDIMLFQVNRDPEIQGFDCYFTTEHSTQR